MRLKAPILALLATACPLLGQTPVHADSSGEDIACGFVAEIAVERFCDDKTKLFIMKKTRRHPVAVAIWMAAHKIACSNTGKPVVKELTKEGCKFIVKVAKGKVTIVVDELEKDAHNASLIYDSLDSYPDMQWLTLKLKQ